MIFSKSVTPLILLFIIVWKKVARMPRFSLPLNFSLIEIRGIWSPFCVLFWWGVVPFSWGAARPASEGTLFDSRPPCRPAIRRLSFHFGSLSFRTVRDVTSPALVHPGIVPTGKRSDSRGHSSQGYYNQICRRVAACETVARTQECLSFRSKFHRGLELVLLV